MVASVPVAWLTKLPTDTLAMPMRPSIGALISVKARLMLACSRAAWAERHGGRRRALIRQVLIDRRLRDRVGPDQVLGSLQRDRRVPLGRLRADQLGLSLVDRRLIGVLLDDEQEVAGLDLLPLGESPLLQEALDTRHQIDRVDGLDASNEGSRRA